MANFELYDHKNFIIDEDDDNVEQSTTMDCLPNRTSSWHRSDENVTCDNSRSFWTVLPVKLKLRTCHANIDTNTVGKSCTSRKSSSFCRSQTIFRQFCLIFMYIFLLNLSTSTCFAARNEETSGCTFPSRWEGSWFQSGVPAPIHIKGSVITNRGRCIASDGDKFLLVSGGCHRCVVIYEKHKNVLQYKESPGCRQRETLQYLCEQIPGDALLYSMFKENAEAVKCPLKGPFTFTYNRGHGECKNPVSNIESCTEDSRLLLSFQACPDVHDTESTVEELTCLATWKDGNARYLVGLVTHHHATSNEERFRCFVYEKIQSMGGAKDAEYKLAQSGDATCNGLESAEVGSRIMTLRKAQPTERCDFPTWFKGPKHWHALMGNAGYVFHQSDGSMHILKQTGYMETRALCEQINKQTQDEMQAVVHYTTGCKSGFMCMIFYRRDTHVAEIQMGKPATRVEDACAPDHFDPNKMPYVTLLATNAESSVCPMEGSYLIRGRIGPPYMTSRHKRGHAHHHHDTYHRRHGTLSFRNSEESEQLWQSAGRSLSPRHRRAIIDEENTEEEPITALEPRSKRDSPGCMIDFKANRRLRMGCTQHNVIDVNPSCSDEGDEEYLCHGQWTENSTTFVVAKHVGSSHGVCITFKQNPDGQTGNFIVGDSCFRSTPTQMTPSDRHLVSNITQFSTCSDTSSSTTTQWSATVMLVCTFFTLLR
ncbi:uncharacterized protein LOC134836085 isoform X2 [Culicoides brevitarsis]|uniref:uncharacterized protein LOC134836085 isoform X2 n=1 Tax=Culicoides brevitarsis TaxID=469753 RepID=UPI00307BCE83